MTREDFKDLIVKEAGVSGSVADAYIDGFLKKAEESGLDKEAALPLIPLALGALSLWSGGKAVYDASKGNWGSAGLNALGAIPGIGILGKGVGAAAKGLGAMRGAGMLGRAGGAMTGWAQSGKMLPKFLGAGYGLANPGKTLAFAGAAEGLGRVMGPAQQAAPQVARGGMQPMMQMRQPMMGQMPMMQQPMMPQMPMPQAQQMYQGQQGLPIR